ncbi:MAG: hypothetical protein QNK05_06095 [Myxococcota bacterium]|nr:hypothetical protein [Myxococcota bacterium]
MDPKILARIERELGIPDAVERLSALRGSDLQSLWLALSERRADAQTPPGLLAEWERNRFVRPSALPRTDFARVEQAFLDALPDGTRSLQLSPLAPHASCSGMATVSQHKVVSAERGTEVLPDPTNVLALEAALQRRTLLLADSRSRERVRLASVCRVVRAQMPKVPEHVPHFGLAASVTAGRDVGSLGFELETLCEQLDLAVRFVSALDAKAEQRVLLTPLADALPEERLRERIGDVLESRHPNLRVELDPSRESGRSYYVTLCFKHRTRLGDAPEFEAGDGGFTDWTARMLSNRKERCLILGIGLERLAAAT